MIITLGGTPGSGKSTVGKRLAKRLGYKFYNAGDVRRKYAIDHGMTLEELNKAAEKDSTSDKLVDDYLAELGEKEDDFVIDSRLGFYFIKKSIKVFIDAEDDVRAKRIMKDKRSEESFRDLEDAKKKITLRLLCDRKRYQKLYGVDPYIPEQYDLIIDSSHKSVESIVGEIYRFAVFNSHPPKRR
ncbi:cytidylate kinase family protein [Candidatus Woesearchaeota archaeon]|nr:cytidylate kinase family protein [Candidatus Woesearchaeota archaeon]